MFSVLSISLKRYLDQWHGTAGVDVAGDHVTIGGGTFQGLTLSCAGGGGERDSPTGCAGHDLRATSDRSACDHLDDTVAIHADGFARSLVVMLSIVVGVPVGFHLGGLEGMVWAVALSEFPAALVLWPASAKRKLFHPSRELLSLILFGLGLLLGACVRFATTQA